MKVGDSLVTAHEEKEAAIYSHFYDNIGTKTTRATDINWHLLEMPTVQAGGPDNPFSEEEIWEAIKASQLEKAHGPYGFTGNFFRTCWPLIKTDVLQAF